MLLKAGIPREERLYAREGIDSGLAGLFFNQLSLFLRQWGGRIPGSFFTYCGGFCHTDILFSSGSIWRLFAEDFTSLLTKGGPRFEGGGMLMIRSGFLSLDPGLNSISG